MMRVEERLCAALLMKSLLDRIIVAAAEGDDPAGGLREAADLLRCPEGLFADAEEAERDGRIDELRCWWSLSCVMALVESK